jgi:hypothetical protein
MKLLQERKSDPCRKVSEDLSLLGHDAVTLGETHLYLKSSSPIFLHDVIPKIRPLRSFEHCDTYPVSYHHVPEDLNLQQNCCRNLKFTHNAFSPQDTVMITLEPYKCQNRTVRPALCLPCTCSCTYLTNASVILFSMNVRIFISVDSTSSQR